jgi:uncharacterized protein (DUF305 family)
MEKRYAMHLVAGLLLGVLITWAVAASAVNSRNASMMRMMGMKSDAGTTSTIGGTGHDMMDHESDMADMSMNAMVSELEGVAGDEFDKKFIASMIAHHQGAIDMANAAKAQAKHDEINKMADDIISAQTKEIDQMKAWQQRWGY